MPIEIKNLDGELLRIVDAADLRGADLQGADLRGADLQGADLQGADLAEIHLSFSSHDLLAEILRRSAAGNIDRLQVAGLVLLQRDWCWADFLAIDHPQKAWALDALRPWVRDGDDAPECLRKT